MLSPGTINAFQGRIQTRYFDKTQAQSIKKEDHGNSFDELSGYLLQLLPNGILTGLDLSLSGSNVLIEPGTWMIDSFVYSIISQLSLPIDAQDVTYDRYDVLYADDTGNISLVSGSLSLTPIEPAIPDGTIKVGSILITPNDVTIFPPPITDYVNTTSNQTVGGVKNFMDGIESVTMPLGDSSLNVATTEFVQNEINAEAIFFLTGTFNGAGTDPDIGGTPYSMNSYNGITSDTTGTWLGGSLTKATTVDNSAFSLTFTGSPQVPNGVSGNDAVNFSQLGSVGIWGNITGTLSNQTDLQTALNNRELIANKATNFGTLNNTLYPTTQAVSNYITAFSYISNITGIVAGGELSGTYPNPTLVTSAVTGKLLTGLSVSGSTILATDSILSAFGKTQSQINALTTGILYKGLWNASTNSPALTSGVGTRGDLWIVGTGGVTSLDGITSWAVGDEVLFNGTVYQKVPAAVPGVISFNTRVGAITLLSSDVTTALGYTPGTGSVTNVSVVTANGVSATITNPTTTPAITINLGVLTAGTWNATIISPTYGGTGINNGGKTITLGGNLTTAGAFNTTLTSTGTTTLTLPTTGTLATLTGTETFQNKTLIAPRLNTTSVAGQYWRATDTLGNGAWATVATGVSTISGVNVNGFTWTITNPTTTPVLSLAFTGNSNLVTVGTIATGTWNATTISTLKGGTGLTAYVTGDILYASATNVLSRRAIGANGRVLTVVAGVPQWVALPTGLTGLTGLSGDVTASGPGVGVATLSTTGVTANSYTNANITVDAKGRITTASNGSGGFPNPMTTTGDTIYSSSGSTPARLAIGSNNQIFTSNGTIPGWSSNINGTALSFYDPTSSIQTQFNTIDSSLTTFTSIVSTYVNSDSIFISPNSTYVFGTLSHGLTAVNTHTGGTATWTLPSLASRPGNSTVWKIFIKNRGSNNLIINSNTGGNDIFTTSAVSSITIPVGGTAWLINDGTYFNSYISSSGAGTVTLTGDITGSGTSSIATTLSAGVVGISNLSATGTPTSSTYLRGDNTWATVTGGTVTAISIASANGFTGTSSGGATPALTLTLQNATTSQSGQLTSADWNTFNNKQAAGGTISGVSLGGTLATLSATDSTLTFSGSYTGTTARTVGINLANANIWTAQQTHNFNSASPPAVAFAGQTALQIIGADASTNVVELVAGAGHTLIEGWRYNGTAASKTGLVTDDEIIAFGGGGWFNSTTRTTEAAAALQFYAAETWSSSANGSYATLKVTKKGTLATLLTTAQQWNDDSSSGVIGNFGVGEGKIQNPSGYTGRQIFEVYGSTASGASGPPTVVLLANSAITSGTVGEIDFDASVNSGGYNIARIYSQLNGSTTPNMGGNMVFQTKVGGGSLATFMSADNTQQLTFGGYSTTGIAHLSSSGVLTSSLIVNADITNSTIDLTTKVTGLLPDGNISSATNWNTAYTNRITSLTTTGSSGNSTLISNVLNIPTYTLAGLGGVATTVTVAGFALSGNVTLAALTATDASLTFSGSYTGATARTVGLNLGNANIFTALQTASNFATSGNITQSAWANASTTAATGIVANFASATYTDNTTATGTVSNIDGILMKQPTFAASNSGVIYTSASTLHIIGAPVAGTNVTLSNTYALKVDGGLTSLVGGISTNNNSTSSNLFAQGAGAIGLLNNTAAGLLFGGAPNISSRSYFNGQTSTTITAANSYGGVIFGAQPVTMNTSGTSAWLANVVVNGLGTVTNASSVPITNTASLYVNAASSAGTNNYGIYNAGNFATTHIIGITSAPTIAAGTGAGTSPTVTVSGTDLGHQVNVTSGTSPSVSAIVATVTYNVAYGVAPKSIILTPANAVTAALNGSAQVYVDSSSTSTTVYVIKVGSGGLAASTAYSWFCMIIQ